MADEVSLVVCQSFSCNISRCVRLSCALALVSGTTYVLYKYIKKSTEFSRNNFKETSPFIRQVLFFPDKKIACKSFLSGVNCSRSICPYAHEDTSLSKLIKTIMEAKSTLDVCVFTINCHELANAVVELHKKGVVVRILTDDEQMGSSGSQIQKFREQGIRVRHDLSSFFMHHKFVIIDNCLIANGSFNWTRQAVTGNRENVVITNEAQIVKAFSEEFEKLWIEYDPASRS
uniref:Mitochondrial cardiolipin hydrolase n=1 Tax=Actinia equina TaxID=6106 RepID=A0A2S1PS15_ACTEQ|nr:putative zucchini [Actinia equina]